MKLGPKALLPAIVFTTGLLATTALVAVRPAAKPVRPQYKPAAVRVIEVVSRPLRMRVHAQGSVEPRTESELVTEVSGRIVWVAPELEVGGFFRAGATLLRVDPSDYETALERAIAALQRAESRRSLARATLERRRSLRAAGASSAASLEEAESLASVADADLRDARANLRQARLELDRTEVKAPFDGRVREKWVDVGQFVSRGSRAARVYAVDYAEVRLPIPSEELAFLDLSLGFDEKGGDDPQGPAPSGGASVTLSGSFAGRIHTWQGVLVRTEGALDPRTRMVQVVARVDAPYARGDDPQKPPLEIGLFVDAEIEGRLVEDLVEIPRSALRDADRVLVIDADSRMHLRRVDVLRREGERLLVRAGLAQGERVAITPLEVVVDGMPVRVVGPEPQPEGEATARKSTDS